MIFGHFDNMNNSGVPVIIQDLLKDNRLSMDTLSELEQGLYTIEGTDVTYLVKDFSTDYRGNRPAEFHDKFVDLQLVVRGKETIYFDNSHEPQKPLSNPKPDVYLIEPSGLSNRVDLTEGDFAIFLTKESHQALCCERGQELVKKVVFKIPKEIFFSHQ